MVEDSFVGTSNRKKTALEIAIPPKIAKATPALVCCQRKPNRNPAGMAPIPPIIVDQPNAVPRSASVASELVQCKQWKTRQVKVSVVREMWGLLQHHGADAVKIVCVGTFTADAEQFAQGKAIELINGEHLLGLVRSVQSPARIVSTEPSRPSKPPTTTSPDCPRCAAPMLMRSNGKTGQPFWACSKYPQCRGTKPA